MQVDNIKRIHRAVFELLVPKGEIKDVLAGHPVAMVSCCVMKMITTYLPMIGRFFDPMTVSSDNYKE